MTAETPGGGGLTEAVDAALRVRYYLEVLNGFYGDDEQPDDVIDYATGDPDSADLRLSDIRLIADTLAAAVQARAEVVARVEAESAAKVLHEMACEDNPGHADWTDCATTGPCRDEGERFATLAALAGPNLRGGQDGGGE